MDNPWNRFSSWPPSGDFVANTEPSDISPISTGGILGNLGQFIQIRPAAQFPTVPWNGPGALLRRTLAPWPTQSSVEAYDPEALNFAATWRRMYSTPWPPVFGPAGDRSRSHNQGYGQSLNRAEEPEFLSDNAYDRDLTRDAEVNGRHEFSPRPLPNQVTGRPGVNVSAYSTPSAAAIPANFQAGARPWWTPVPVPDVFDPWREHASKGLLGLYKYFFDRGSYSSGGDRNGPGCEEEWEEARKQCAQWLSTRNPPRGVTGGYRNVEDCARGLVSERCGGNPVKW